MLVCTCRIAGQHRRWLVRRSVRDGGAQVALEDMCKNTLWLSLTFQVLEHVADQKQFINCCRTLLAVRAGSLACSPEHHECDVGFGVKCRRECVRACSQPGGSLFVSSISRTALSYLLAIVAAERLLGLVPPGAVKYVPCGRPFIARAHLRHPRLAEISHSVRSHADMRGGACCNGLRFPR